VLCGMKWGRMMRIEIGAGWRRIGVIILGMGTWVLGTCVSAYQIHWTDGPHGWGIHVLMGLTLLLIAVAGCGVTGVLAFFGFKWLQDGFHKKDGAKFRVIRSNKKALGSGELSVSDASGGELSEAD